MNLKNIEKIIKSHNLKIEIANDNSPGQVVISGANLDIQNSEKVFISNGLKRFVKLNVSKDKSSLSSIYLKHLATSIKGTKLF